MFGAGPASTPGIAAAPPRAPHPPPGPTGTGAMVSFARSGLNVRWQPAFNNLLELAEACDVPVRWACRTGVCHNCESGLVSGNVGYRPSPIDAPMDGNLLICCSQPEGDVVLDL
jgi:ferredoxin